MAVLAPLTRGGGAAMVVALLLAATGGQTESDAQERLRIEVTFPASLGAGPFDGRVLVMLSTESDGEPRFQINDSPRTQQVFGVDVEGLQPDQPAVVTTATLGYPKESLAHVPAGTYTVQALLHKYETFVRADGHTVKLPMDRGEGQQWNRAPGNLHSTPKKVMVDAAKGGVVSIALDRVIAPIPDPPTTKYIKHTRRGSSTGF